MNTIKKYSILMRCSAFTLMEILIAIGIIMLMTGLAIPFYGKMLARGRKAAATTQIQNFEMAITNFQIDTGKIPKDLNGLLTDSSSNKKWDGPYLKVKEIPKDPWGNNFVFELSTSAGQNYKIISYGSDGAPGGAGDAEDLTN